MQTRQSCLSPREMHCELWCHALFDAICLFISLKDLSWVSCFYICSFGSTTTKVLCLDTLNLQIDNCDSATCFAKVAIQSIRLVLLNRSSTP